MSGIYIDGIEMPRNGHTVTITILPSGEACVDHYDCRPQLTVPILYNTIPVPDHGGLIDEKVTVEKIKKWFPPNIPPEWEQPINECIRAITAQSNPTIIPEDGEGENE